MAKLSKKLDYFDAFEQQADLVIEEAVLLVEAIESYKSCNELESIMERAHDIENKGDVICHDIFTAIATDFITPIEREDIMQMTQFLDDIIDYTEDVIQRFYMYDIEVMHESTLEFAKIIEKGSRAIKAAMDDFRNFKKSKNFTQRIIEINSLEEEADALFMHIMRSMHTKDKNDPLKILVWSQLFARMERCTDACEHVADTMRTIMLKNS